MFLIPLQAATLIAAPLNGTGFGLAEALTLAGVVGGEGVAGDDEAPRGLQAPDGAFWRLDCPRSVG